jgi:hypothetical protein
MALELRDFSGITYVAVPVRKGTLRRAETAGHVVGNIPEFEDFTCGWYTRDPGPTGEGSTRTLAEANAALEAHLQRRG